MPVVAPMAIRTVEAFVLRFEAVAVAVRALFANLRRGRSGFAIITLGTESAARG